jgi:hypothetical protein
MCSGIYYISFKQYQYDEGKDVQLGGYSVMLTIKNLKELDCNVSYRLQLSYGAASQTV